MIKLAVDLLGSDKGELELLDGVLSSINSKPDLFVYAFGTKEKLEEALKSKNYNKEQLEIIDSSEVITNSENPMEAIRSKTDASMIKAAAFCRDNDEVGALVSCGATGGLMVTSMFIVRPLSAAITPVLLCELLKRNGQYICLSDCGANIESPAEKILDFAKMAVAYMKAKGVENPKIRLLSNGAEDGKGTKKVKDAFALLKESNLNFLGNVEGSTALTTDADIIATDGFEGNVLLKSLECGANSVINDIRDMADTLDDKEKELLFSITDKYRKKYDYNTQGGAVLLGVKKPVVKGHGAATAETMMSIIDIAYTLAKNNIVDKIKEEFSLK